MQYIFLPLLLLFSSCSFQEEVVETPTPQEEPVKEDKIQPLVETFVPVSVIDGLIEMESENRGDYTVPAMVLISKGKFVMGDAIGVGDSSERPIHAVNINYEFFIGKYEVTFNEYDKFAKDTGRPLPDDGGFGRRENPVINVSFEDATAYAQWLSGKTGDKYRLPTEAEWEFVARAGSEDRFFFGDSTKDLKRYGWYWANSNETIQPVGQKLPNMWNVHDMIGNVWEWCQDWYVENYDNATNDGTPYNIKGEARVVRGGSWNDEENSMRLSIRTGYPPTVKMNDTGFRLVMDY
jgi:formylglycine-generating enzyme required for sulfatase activity